MTLDEAIRFIRPAVPPSGGVWVDFGAGAGLFTRALARLLGSAGRLYAVDRDVRTLAPLRRLVDEQPDTEAVIVPVIGDFERLAELEELPSSGWAGAFFGNALHYTPTPAGILAAAASRLAPGGRILVVEYADRRPNRWVPFPLALVDLARAAEAASLGAPRLVAERASRFGGRMYCAVLERG